ncbi:MAG TPA: SdpI family protein [Candidatus Kapabacteria bacterium]|nr:SdpI family protein [Candidatus Kapabacteria bacterium]
MSKEFIKKEWIFWVILAIPFIYAAFVWNSLPDKIPIHWDAKGEPNGYGSKLFGGLLVPGIGIALYLLLLVLPKIDPRKKNYESFAGTYRNIRLALSLFMMIFYFFSIQTALGNASPKWINVVGFTFLAFLGNYMRTVRPNWFIGIRTPWTLESPEVWKRTHDIGGKLFFYSGVIGIIFTLIAGSEYGWIPFTVLMASAAFTVVYSFVIYKKLEKETNQIQ